MRRSAALLAAATVLASATAHGELPRAVARAFLAAGVPLNHVAVVVQRTDARQPLFAHGADVPMNPASTMKLVTTFAALELLGPEHRWRTEAHLGGPLADGTLKGDLILRGAGDPKITIEQWQAFMAELRARGLERIDGDLVLDRSQFRLPTHDAAQFDAEPLRPYNVGPDALLVNFKAVRFAFAPNAAGDAVDVVVEPTLPQLTVGPPPSLVDGDCGDWRRALAATFVSQPRAANVAFAGRFARSCGERDWHVALLDHRTYVHGMFMTYFAQAGGHFAGGVRDGRAPQGAPFAVLASMPLYDIVRDVNKLSNNVMARQLYLTLGAREAGPPATPDKAFAAVSRWLARRKLSMPGLVIENGSGLSRNERVTAAGLARLLAAADASPVREEFASSLAVAATDGTLVRRMHNGSAVGRALLKTGSLEGVRSLAGYAIDAQGTRWIVVAMVNDAKAAQSNPAMDFLADWVIRNASVWTRERR